MVTRLKVLKWHLAAPSLDENGVVALHVLAPLPPEQRLEYLRVVSVKDVEHAQVVRALKSFSSSSSYAPSIDWTMYSHTGALCSGHLRQYADLMIAPSSVV